MVRKLTLLMSGNRLDEQDRFLSNRWANLSGQLVGNPDDIAATLYESACHSVLDA